MYRRSGWYDPESSWKRYRIYVRFRSEEVVEKGGRSRGKGKEVVEGSRAKGYIVQCKRVERPGEGKESQGQGLSGCWPLPKAIFRPVIESVSRLDIGRTLIAPNTAW